MVWTNSPVRSLVYQISMFLILWPMLALGQTFVEGSLIEACNRTEALTVGGAWVNDVINGDASTVEANGTVCLKAVEEGVGSAAYQPGSYGPDVVFSMTMPDATGGSTGRWISLFVRLTDPGAVTMTSYNCSFLPMDDTVYLYRQDPTGQLLETCTSVTLADGDKIGCRMRGSTLSAHRDSGGGWASVCSTTDGTYTAAGDVGIRLTHADVTVDDLKAGTISPLSQGEVVWSLIE